VVDNHDIQRRRPISSAAEHPNDRYSIAVLGKTLDVLEALEGEGQPTLTELSARAGIPKATTLRILANLESRNYVDRDIHGRYRLGLRLLQLGARATAGIDLRNVAQPVMEALRDEFEETVNLALPTNNGIVYIEILQSAHGLRMAASVGMRDAYHSSALGKAILAHLPDGRADEIIGPDPLERKTSRTLVTRASLFRELDQVRKQRFAIDEEENEIGARCIGAPIFDHLGTCIGAVSVSGPVSRLTSERAGVIADWVIAAAASISRHLGHRDGKLPSHHSPKNAREPATP
jgi:IclR family acetate operon transcriptional repressor